MAKKEMSSHLEVEVNGEEEVVKFHGKLNMDLEEAYLECVEMILKKTGSEAIKYAWVFDDKKFNSLKDMAEFFEKAGQNKILGIIKDISEKVKDKPLGTRGRLLLETTKKVLETLTEVIEEYLTDLKEEEKDGD